MTLCYGSVYMLTEKQVWLLCILHSTLMDIWRFEKRTCILLSIATTFLTVWRNIMHLFIEAVLRLYALNFLGCASYYGLDTRQIRAPLRMSDIICLVYDNGSQFQSVPCKGSPIRIGQNGPFYYPAPFSVDEIALHLIHSEAWRHELILFFDQL